MQTTSTREFLTFKDAKTGELVRLDQEARYDDYTGYRFTDDVTCPVFEAKNESQLTSILLDNTPSYNARKETPGWGPFTDGRLVAVRATVTTVLEDVEFIAPKRVDTLDVRKIPYKVALKYADGQLPDAARTGDTFFWVVELPEAMTLPQAREWEGEDVFGGDRFSKRTLYRALDLPEEYQDLYGSRNVVLFIGSDVVYDV